MTLLTTQLQIKKAMTSYLDTLPTDCMEKIIDTRVSQMENQIQKIENSVLKKLKDDYEKEKKRTPDKFNFAALRAAVNISVFNRNIN